MQNNVEKYYNITKNIQPHLNVQKFLDYKLPPQKAIDIGCGAGRDTVALIKNNWEVLAIDKENTKSIIMESLNEQEKSRLKFMNCTFGDMKIPKANLVVANFSLPFSRKDYFNLIWKKIDDAIIENGYFVGNFFGKKDSWINIKNDLVFLSEQEVKLLFKNFELIQFNEIEKDAKIASGEVKHWHIYDVIAKKCTILGRRN